jgi:hypothetical protein
MPQTVAMQRGSVSSTASGGWITLFTQSSGIATRVIPINFEHWLSQNPNNNTGYFQLAIVSSSGGGQIISSYNGTPSQNLNSFQITCTNTNAADIATVSTTAVGRSIQWRTSSSGSSPYNASISNVSAGYGTTAQGNANAIGQFFMGSGDSLRYRITAIFNQGKGTSPCTTNASFSFVTITES